MRFSLAVERILARHVPEPKTGCSECGAEILVATAERTGGTCMPCRRRENPQLSAQSFLSDFLANFPDIDDPLVQARWPTTLNEAVTRIIEDMDDADKKRLRCMEKHQLVSFHFSWGMGIRNEFGLTRNTKLLADCHAQDADEASMVIIEAVFCELWFRSE